MILERTTVIPSACVCLPRPPNLLSRWAFGLLFWACLPFSWALAETEEPPKDRKEANALYKEARTMVVEAKYKPALQRFHRILRFLETSEASAPPKRKAAWNKERLSLLFVIGRTYEYDQQWTQAYQTYHACLALQPKAKTQALLQRRLAAIADKVRSALALLTQPPASASITDSQGQAHQGQTPTRWLLPPGPFSLRLSAPGFQPLTLSLRLEPGQNLQASYTLQPLSPPHRLEPPATRPLASSLPTDPRTSQALPPTSRPLHLLPPRPPSPPPNLPPAWLSPLLWTSLALGLAAGGIGAGLFAGAHSEYKAFLQKHGQPSQCSAQGPDPSLCTAEILRHKSTGETFQAAAVGLWISSGVFLSFSLVLAIWRASFPPPPQPLGTALLGEPPPAPRKGTSSP